MDSTTRRSSRANRASQPPLSSTSHHSSASSSNSSRADRPTRSNPKLESPRKSTPSDSLSSEAPDEIGAGAAGEIQTRRKRARGEEQQGKKRDADINGDEDGAEEEEEEAVRCVCGLEDYPGPPQTTGEDNKHGIKQGIEEPIITAADVTEDVAGFFLQCDMCKVWQHGGCVGILSEEQSPDEYFCEQCRTDLHKMFVASNGQRYSHYLPLWQNPSRATSRAASSSKDGTRSPRGNRNERQSSFQAGKRRSTMNSRDAAYDEEEQLRRAIEASRGEKSGGDSIDGGTRQAKRARGESEENPENPKRQRTTSASPSPVGDQRRVASQADSDEGATTRVNGGNKKIRGAAARNQREKEEKERERAKIEAGKVRGARYSERHKLDDDPDDIPLARATANKTAEITAQPLDPPAPSQAVAPDTPPPILPPSHKKGGRPPNGRKGKLGRNQYTKDRDTAENDDRSPGRSQSRDVARDESVAVKALTSENRVGKSKSTNNSRFTMSELRKRATAMLDFIGRTQVDLAKDSLLSGDDNLARSLLSSTAEDLPKIKLNGEGGQKDGESVAPTKEFRDLSCIEMMDDLSRQLVKWQKEYT